MRLIPLFLSDKWVNNGAPPPVSNITGFTVFALAFYLVSGPTDMAQGWMLLDPSVRSSIKASYSAAGISLVVAGMKYSQYLKGCLLTLLIAVHSVWIDRSTYNARSRSDQGSK